MRTAIFAAVALATLILASTAVSAATLTEQQARLKAAEWIRERAVATKAGPADKTIFEILNHVRESLLVLRGNTGYCGFIRRRTWVLIFDREGSAWNGGNPVMVDARSGKILECKS